MLTIRQRQHIERNRVGWPKPYKLFDDGMCIYIYSMAYGNGRLCYGHSDDRYGFSKFWCYKSLEAAFSAADEWDGSGEPHKWKKNGQTQEYRKEYE
jgi:hypothetical protein